MLRVVLLLLCLASLAGCSEPAPTGGPGNERRSTTETRVSVGFLQFSFVEKTRYQGPAEIVWYSIRNQSDIPRKLSQSLWSAHDSAGNPYENPLLTLETFLHVRGPDDCWEWISGGYDFYLSPYTTGCEAGSIWHLAEPDVTITSVSYNGHSLPMVPVR